MVLASTGNHQCSLARGLIVLPCQGSGLSQERHSWQRSLHHFPSPPAGSDCFPGRQGRSYASPLPPPTAPTTSSLHSLSLPVQRSPQLSAHHTCRHLTKAFRRKITSLPNPFSVSAFLEPERRTLLGTSPEFLHFRCSSNRPLSWPLSTRRLHYGKRNWGWGQTYRVSNR